MRKFYKGIKELNRPYQSESVTIKDEYGKPLMEQNKYWIDGNNTLKVY